MNEAIEAAKRGWKIFPIKTMQKKPPIFKDWENIASSDPEQIRKWGEKYKNCNWGVACGPSNLVVIDVDIKDGKPGRETLAALEAKYGPLPQCRMAITPSGGYHYYFTGLCSSGTDKLGPGIDIKSSGGYVVLPGSKTENGAYNWLEF